MPYRISLIGNYGTDLGLKRDINRFLATDPYGTAALVEFGIERSEVRTDIDKELIASMLNWLTGQFQDSLLTEELDPGLFHRTGDTPEKRQARIDQFVEMIRSAIGVRS